MGEDRVQQGAARTTEMRIKKQQDVEIRSKKQHDMQKPETSKRGRVQCIDEPEMPARKKQAKASSDKSITCKIRRPKLVIKIGVKVLVDAIEKMNSKQLAALEDMGFGQLVHLKIRYIPADMAFSLLENFNHDNCSRIKLVDDQPLHITEEDVYATLGLPRGELMIKSQKKHVMNDVMKTIVEAKNRKAITPADLQEQLDSDPEGGEWFKKIFLILLDNVLISPTANGNCLGRILDDIGNISNVRQYNWCSYVLDTLITTHDSWKRKNKSTPFTGPITFLLACYVDRVVYRTRLVVRRFPTVRNWTESILKERGQMEFDNGGTIGRGNIECIIDPVSIESLYANKYSITVNTSVPSTDEAPLPDEAPPATDEAPLQVIKFLHLMKLKDQLGRLQMLLLK
ncbi:uncharacterized protein LOC121800696 [Salvia splendens]|uniref:uncharacterized protein LOC121800696 n=1 Tax=Salvia splendens TaxID=180675 RepID=UPI001C262BEA|nr:uncharacterized protein LOC121800696 [Salvia splendens]